jgi:nicotinate-nucleotide pyrophosphorylase (carboxylating)
MISLAAEDIHGHVRLALSEDLGSGDVTSLATVPAEASARAVMVARQALVVAGVDFARAAFEQRSARVEIEVVCADGMAAEAGQVILRVNGPARALLEAERVALNYVQRLSGIATMTRRFVTAVAGTSARILDTRKTTPGWRRFEKYAVACGGGANHRQGLYDQVLIKDNHLAMLRGEHPNPVAAAVSRARAAFPGLRVEVEADTLDQVREALDAGADIVLLDNMDPEQVKAAVALVAGRIRTEASGGVSLQNVRGLAEAGVDDISVGALTHSAGSVDVGLDFEEICAA